MALEQIGITLSGVIAIWLSQDERAAWRRWACIFGMLGQPFWFYAAWKAEQWGIFALCTLYTYAWARGVWTHWLSPYVQAKDGQAAETRWLMKPAERAPQLQAAPGSRSRVFHNSHDVR